jgi:hypothetical protein
MEMLVNRVKEGVMVHLAPLFHPAPLDQLDQLVNVEIMEILVTLVLLERLDL